MRFAIPCSLKVAALVTLAAPLPTPAAAEFKVAVPYTQWRSSPDLYRQPGIRQPPSSEDRSLLPIQCAAASDACGWKRIPGEPQFEGFRSFRRR